MALDQTNAALDTLSATVAAVLPVLQAAQSSEANEAALDTSLAGSIAALNGQLAPFVPAPASTGATDGSAPAA